MLKSLALRPLSRDMPCEERRVEAPRHWGSDTTSRCFTVKRNPHLRRQKHLRQQEPDCKDTEHRKVLGDTLRMSYHCRLSAVAVVVVISCLGLALGGS